MGYQSGINQLLGMAAAGGYLVNKELSNKSAAIYNTKMAKIENQEDYIKAMKEYNPIGSQLAEAPLKGVKDETALTYENKPNTIIGNIGYSIKSKEGKSPESLVSEFMEAGEQEQARINAQQIKESLGKSHMQQNGQSKTKERMTFKRFFNDLKENPPEVFGDKTLYNRLGSSAQEQVARQLYDQRRKK